MPELPEVETVRRGLLPQLKGQTIAEVELRRRQLRFPLPAGFEERLAGRTITNIRRRAKYLLFDLDDGAAVLAHLGMSGSFRVVAAGDYAPKKHDHVLWHMENGEVCVFHDPRRFGLMDVLEKGREKSHPLLKNLGPEPFSEDFSPAYLTAKLARRTIPIKPVLMDQKLVVGVGNIYASEALFLARIHPAVQAVKTAKKSQLLIDSIRAVLNDAIGSGGSTLRDFVGADGKGGYFQHRFQVYERAGKACYRCGATIKSMVQAGRTTYWCPRCQRAPAKPRKT